MLSFTLVLLVAASAFALPSVGVYQYSIQEVPFPRDNGRLVSSYLTIGGQELVDGGDTNIYILTIGQILNDLANQSSAEGQVLAVSQLIALLGELATGNSGDSCTAAALIDAYAFAVGSGNYAGVRPALAAWIARLQVDIDLISTLSSNPAAVRYSTGPRNNCAGAGRTYQFEAAWSAVLDNASPGTIGLLNEEYCAAKRLYTAFNSRSNNVGAAVTAASIKPVTKVIKIALNPLANFIRAAIAGGNSSKAASVAKQALSQALAEVTL